MDMAFPYSVRMPRSSKSEPDETKVSKTALVLAENVKKMMLSNKELNSNPKLAKKTGVGTSGVSRLIHGHNATVATVEAVAKAFGLEPWQLLVKGLEPGNPPTPQPLSERERQLYLRWKELAKETVSGW